MQVRVKSEKPRWRFKQPKSNYVNDAIIEPTISQDILLITQVNKPILLRRLFQIGCNYSGQILSYNKMLVDLQDAGNTTRLAHYLELLSAAWLLTGLQKFTKQIVRRKGSSPKFAVFNPALVTAQSGRSFIEAKSDRSWWARLVESVVSSHLLNSIRGSQIELFYWREGDQEVDFVLSSGGKITAIEVKSNDDTIRRSAMDFFVKKFNPRRVLLVGDQGIPLEMFLTHPVQSWLD